MLAYVVDLGRKVEATAERFQADATTVRTWRDRFLTERVDLLDRSSSPTRSPTGRPHMTRRLVAV
jgi:hypothetical protein